jgi:hypothetical protein
MVHNPTNYFYQRTPTPKLLTISQCMVHGPQEHLPELVDNPEQISRSIPEQILNKYIPIILNKYIPINS